MPIVSLHVFRGAPTRLHVLCDFEAHLSEIAPILIKVPWDRYIWIVEPKDCRLSN